MRGRPWAVLIAGVLLLFVGGGIEAEASPRGESNKEASVVWYLDPDTYPIGLWWPPPPEETTPERYGELKEAGFTFFIGGNGLINMPINQRVLELAEANGLTVVVSDSRYTHRDPEQVDPAQLRSELAAAYETYRQSPAFGGFHLFDEPRAQQFAQLRALRDAFDDVAKK